MKKTLIIMVLSIFMLLFSSCWEDKSFHVKKAHVYIDVQRLDRWKFLGYQRFRVYIYRNDEDRGKDYIDIRYGMSDMPSIRLSIPKFENNKIFVIDSWHEVERIRSSEFNFDILSYERTKNGEMITIAELESIERTSARIDSVMDSIPSVIIQLNSGLTDLTVWRNGKYEDRKMVYPENSKE